MGDRWEIRIGTQTTPRKQSALRAALAGTMLTRHYQYIQPIYQSALFWRLKNILPASTPNNDIIQFAEDRINDAFIRIKEYDELKKADSAYKFRSFLIKKILFPALEEFYRKRKQEREAVEEYFIASEAQKGFDLDYRNEVAKEFVREALLKLKEEDEIKYEVFVRRFFEQKLHREIYEELKEAYPLTITSEKACRQVYDRALDKLKHLFREVTRQGKYVDKDLPFNKFILNKLRAETTDRKSR